MLAWCPFPDDARTRPTAVHVVHLAAAPDPDRVAGVVTQDWAPDGLAVRGPELVVSYAETMRASRLQHAALLRRLAVDGTGRDGVAALPRCHGRRPTEGFRGVSCR